MTYRERRVVREVMENAQMAQARKWHVTMSTQGAYGSHYIEMTPYIPFPGPPHPTLSIIV